MLKIMSRGKFYSSQLERDVARALRERNLRVIDICTLRSREGIWIYPATFYSIVAGRVDFRRASQAAELVFRELGIDLRRYTPDAELCGDDEHENSRQG